MLSKKILTTIVAVVFAGGVGTAGAIQLANTPKTAATVNSEVSSTISAVSSDISSQIVSSKEANSVDDSVSKIQKATDDGVSKIKSVTSQAVEQVQQATSSSESKPIAKAATNTIKIDSNEFKTEIHLGSCYVSTTSKTLYIGYGYNSGDYSPTVLKSKGLEIKSANGNMNYLTDDKAGIKVPYTNLSDISELYFCLAGQQIKITVTQ